MDHVYIAVVNQNYAAAIPHQDILNTDLCCIVKKSQLQHQKELEVARERIRNRKKRTRRLIQFGAIAESFFPGSDQLTPIALSCAEILAAKPVCHPQQFDHFLLTYRRHGFQCKTNPMNLCFYHSVSFVHCPLGLKLVYPLYIGFPIRPFGKKCAEKMFQYYSFIDTSFTHILCAKLRKVLCPQRTGLCGLKQ